MLCVVCPLPVVSSIRLMLPGPMATFWPLPTSSSARPLSVMTNCRRGPVCQSLTGAAGRLLNSMLDASPDSRQGKWLADDLAKNRTRCTLAYFHHPRFSSGPHNLRQSAADLWPALSDAGVDVVVNGHDHIYERFGPMTKDGDRDNEKGMREFVVGTGGTSHYDIERVADHSEVRNDDTYGVLLLTLHASSYDWRFVPVRERSFRDSGTGSCH